MSFSIVQCCVLTNDESVCLSKVFNLTSLYLNFDQRMVYKGMHNNSMVGTQQLHYLANASANDYIDFRMISGGSQSWYMGVAHMLGYITLLN